MAVWAGRQEEAGGPDPDLDRHHDGDDDGDDVNDDDEDDDNNKCDDDKKNHSHVHFNVSCLSLGSPVSLRRDIYIETEKNQKYPIPWIKNVNI